METTICNSNNEKKHFIHDLKIEVVLLFIKHKVQKGDKIISNFKKMYLSEKFRTSEKEEIDNVLESIPSRENILKLSLKKLFSSLVKTTKEISLSNRSCAKKEKNDVISAVKLINKVHIYGV